MIAAPLVFAAAVFLAAVPALADPAIWAREWPRTDFARTSVAYAEIISGGPPKDGIPAIDRPRFVALAEAPALGANEPVIGLTIGTESRAYPLRILIWHEIVNDEVAGVPVAVTYCPLCNSAIVFDRRVAGETLDFGTTGKLRNSDLVMYDRQSESWWQQFTGEGIIGKHNGARLAMLPSRVESWARFKARAPMGRVLVPTNPGARPYGANPYVGYDSAPVPFLYRGAMPTGIEPLAYVVAVGKSAWPLERIRSAGRLEANDLVLSWVAGKNSALDSERIADGRDIGNVIVQRRVASGLVDEVHDVTFAFVFHAFHPDGTLHLR